ncbi:hypothetical protein DY000_02059033 [Brassica cretica]|uniref:Uncharacterized protein n=1 Tax=Brassica cretica TaxID=69181 RepID=A0ABQ7AXB8_BRACR|nr:hypothetical protein DY000_02059033 [Brassica cretica]
MITFFLRQIQLKEKSELRGRHVTCLDQSLVIMSRMTSADSHNEFTATGTNVREEEFDKNKLIFCYKQQHMAASSAMYRSVEMISRGDLKGTLYRCTKAVEDCNMAMVDLSATKNGFRFCQEAYMSSCLHVFVNKKPGSHITETVLTSMHLVLGGAQRLDLANILHADCTSHGNMRINKTTRPANFLIPSTHGSQQYREDMSTVSIDASSMATCSGGSEHCPHRSFAQPSRSKKSDRNQKTESICCVMMKDMRQSQTKLENKLIAAYALLNLRPEITFCSLVNLQLRYRTRLLSSQAVVYSIWKRRNNMLHNQTSVPPLFIFREIDRNVRNIIHARKCRRRFRKLIECWLI